MTEPRYVGLDVHKRQITACIIDAQGKILQQREIPLTRARLEAFARRTLQPGDHVALEATTNCWAVAETLAGHVTRVVVSNPLVTKAIAQAKVKTDKVDAHVLAQLLRCDYLPSVWHPDAVTQQRRQLTGRRAGLVQDRTAVRNRIHSVLAMRLLEPPEGGLFSKPGLEWLDQVIAQQLDPLGQQMIRSDLALLQSLDEQIVQFDQELARRAYEEPRVRLLMTLPGVDVTVAESVLAALGDIDRFATPEAAASYLGLVPSTRQSGRHCYHGPITKRGNSQARWMLIEAAQHVLHHPGPLGHFFRRLKRRKNHNVAVVAVARKLVMIAWHMLRNNEPYRYAQPQTTATKLARLRIRATGKKRRGGVAKGERATAKLAGGSKTIKALDRVYQEEGLPGRQPLSAGEERTIQAADAKPFVESLAQDRVVPRGQASQALPDAPPRSGSSRGARGNKSSAKPKDGSPRPE
jgi:transposase